MPVGARVKKKGKRYKVRKPRKQYRPPKRSRPKPKPYSSPASITGAKGERKARRQTRRIEKTGKALPAKTREKVRRGPGGKRWRRYRSLREKGKRKVGRTPSLLRGKGKQFKRRAAYLGLKKPESDKERSLAKQGRRARNILDTDRPDVVLAAKGVKPKVLKRETIKSHKQAVREYKANPPKNRTKQLAAGVQAAYSQKEIARLKGKPKAEVDKRREKFKRAQAQAGKLRQKRAAVREARKPGRQFQGFGSLEDAAGGKLDIKLRAKRLKGKGKPPEGAKQDITAGGFAITPQGGVTKKGTRKRVATVRVPGTKRRVYLDEPMEKPRGKLIEEAAINLAPIPVGRGIVGLRALRALKLAKAGKKGIPARAAGKVAAPVKKAVKKARGRGKPKKPAPKPEPKKPTGRKPAATPKPEPKPPKKQPRIVSEPIKVKPKSGAAKEKVLGRFQTFADKRATKVKAAKHRRLGVDTRAGRLVDPSTFVVAKAAVGTRFGPAAVEGHAQAVAENPEKVFETTERILPGLVAAPLGIIENVLAIPAYRATTSLLNIKDYTGAEVTDPIKGEAAAQLDFMREFAATMASGDANRIKEAVLNDYGMLAPIMLAIPAARYVRGGYQRAIKDPLRVRAEVKRIEKGKPTGPRGEQVTLPPATAVGRATERVPVVGELARGRTARRKEEAKGKSWAERQADIETRHASREMLKELRRAVKETGGRKRGRTGTRWNRRDAEATIADALKDVAHRGIPAGKAGVDRIKALRASMGTRPDVGRDVITTHDVFDYILANPEFLSNASFRKAVDLYKAQAEAVTLSPTAQYGALAHDLGEPTPREMMPVSGSGVIRTPARPGVKAKDAIRAELKQDKVEWGKLNRRAARMRAKGKKAEWRQARDQANRLEEQMRTKRQSLYEGIGPRNQEFVRRMEQRIARGEAERPAYASDVRVGKQEQMIGPVPPARAGGKVYETDLKLHDMAMSDPTLGALMRSSVAGPRSRIGYNLNAQRFASHNIPYERGGKSHNIITSQELMRAAVREQYDMDNTVFVPIQQLKGALEEGSPGLVQEMVSFYTEQLAQRGMRGKKRLSADQIVAEWEALARSKNPAYKGTKYMAFDRARAEEFFAQMDKAPFEKAARAQRFATRAILGYSPSWLMLQPIAEGAQGLAAVGPHHMIAGQLTWRKMAPEDKIAFQVLAGETPGAAVTFKDISGLRRSTQAMTDSATQTLLQTPAGWALRTLRPDEAFSFIDRWKGGGIRRVVAMGALHREMRGFIKGQQGFLKGMEKVSKELKGKSLASQAGYMARHPEIARRMESYLDDVMGNWTALTKREKYIAPLVVFYPFVRMSLRWALWSYPKRHPIKASIMAFLAQQNANQLEALLGGPPGFWRQWATVPLYTGEGGRAAGLHDLSRIAPAGNTLTEAIGTYGPDNDKLTTDLVRALNPIIGAGLTGFAGADPLSGRSLVGKGETVSTRVKVGIALAQLVSMPAPIRAAATRLGLQRKLMSKEQSNVGELFEKIQGVTPGERMWRSFIPPVPRKVATERKVQYLSRALEMEYGAPDEWTPRHDRKKRKKDARALAKSYVGRQRRKALEQEYLSPAEKALEPGVNLTGRNEFPENVADLPLRVRRMIRNLGGRSFLERESTLSRAEKRRLSRYYRRRARQTARR